jgi:hypothetical protein
MMNKKKQVIKKRGGGMAAKKMMMGGDVSPRKQMAGSWMNESSGGRYGTLKEKVI